MKRKEARENVFLLLFEGVSKPEAGPAEIFENAVAVRGLETDDYVKKVFFGYYENSEKIEPLIDGCLIGWSKNRVSVASRAIFRLAAYEMLFIDDIPGKVSINEGVELSKKYDDEKSYSFVNGVLNAIADKTGKKDV